MKAIGIIAKKNKPEAAVLVESIVSRLVKKGIAALVEDGGAMATDKIRQGKREDIVQHADILIVLGGDGTLLSVARIPGSERIPILAVNLGGLGFLTEIRINEIDSMLDGIIEGRFTVKERMMLNNTLYRGAGAGEESYQALNDVVINKGALARMIELETFVDQDYLNSFRADGLIISTPTGSTGYSVSAGGPLIHPSLRLIALTPICPHTLTNRPIILNEDSTISVVVKAGDEDIFLTVDGQVGARMALGGRIEVCRSHKTLSLIQNPFRTYYGTLKEKLKWGER